MSLFVDNAVNCLCGSDDVFLVRAPGLFHLKCNFCGRTCQDCETVEKATDTWNRMVESKIKNKRKST